MRMRWPAWGRATTLGLAFVAAIPFFLALYPLAKRIKSSSKKRRERSSDGLSDAVGSSFGLKQVYPPAGSEDHTFVEFVSPGFPIDQYCLHRASIIAIHGLDTSAPETWEYEYRSGPRKGDVVNWLSDQEMLPRSLNYAARIFTYNWPAKYYEDALDLTIRHQAESLLHDITATRKKKRSKVDRPIVFIASCFGGIVLAMALNEAARDGSPYRDIRRVNAGVVFLATPFQGTAAVTKARWLMAYHHAKGARTSAALINSLDKSAQILQDLIHDFDSSRRTKEYNLPIFCFRERDPTNWSTKFLPSQGAAFVKLEEYVVTPDSGRLSGAPADFLDGSHVVMNKFAPNTRNYLLVEHVVSEMVYNARITINERLISVMTDQQQRFVNEVRLSDPQYDKENIKSVKGGLLVDSFQWIVYHSDFQRWRKDDCTFLWISGNPGKGKTMLLIGIIDELAAHQESEIAADVGFLSFFFCQANDSRYNNPAAVLRGLIYLLVNQEPALISNLPKKFNNEMRGSLDDGNAFFVLSEIFEHMICDPILTKACLVIDALDECPVRQKQFLDVIVRCASRAKHVKWLVSSRNERTIENSLSRIEGHKRLRLESNVESVSNAVNTYIDHKVSVLARNKRYEPDLENTVKGYLRSNAEDTFLWVALVCQNLESTSIWNTPRSLQDFPPGLPSIYKRVVQQICDFEDKRDSELCKKILAVATITNRHLILAELATLVDVLSDISAHSEWLVQIIGLCGSFLTIRRGTIYFVHQSAKEYLSTDENVIFPSGTEEVHKTVFSQSLKAMSHTLCRDVYSLRNPGASKFDLAARERDPLEPLRYSCVHWVHHLGRSQSIRSPINPTLVSDVEGFLQNKLLHWLEALVLLESNSDGGLSVAVRSMGSLEKILDGSSMGNTHNPALLRLVRDARRFILYNRPTVEETPLQLYCSALAFSPENSLVRQQFCGQAPQWIRKLLHVQENWTSVLQTLDASPGQHIQSYKVDISPDGRSVASASNDRLVRLWDPDTGELLQTFEGDTGLLEFSPDSKFLASGPILWDLVGGTKLYRLDGHSADITMVAFSPDSRQLASASKDHTIIIWNPTTGSALYLLKGHCDIVNAIAYSKDGALLASASDDGTARIWNPATGCDLWNLKPGLDEPRSTADPSSQQKCYSVAFSLSGHDVLASSHEDGTVRLWDPTSGSSLRVIKAADYEAIRATVFSPKRNIMATLADQAKSVRMWDPFTGNLLHSPSRPEFFYNSMKFSREGHLFAFASNENTVKVWDPESGALLRTFHGHRAHVCSVAFSPKSNLLASTSWDGTVRLWDLSVEDAAASKSQRSHSLPVSIVTLSSECKILASGSDDGTVRIWDATTGEPIGNIADHSCKVDWIEFSPDSRLLASIYHDGTIEIWDLVRWTLLNTFQYLKDGHRDPYRWNILFSPDGKMIASAAYGISNVTLWEAGSGERLHSFTARSSSVSRIGDAKFTRALAFSPKGELLATATDEYEIILWSTKTGGLQHKLPGHENTISEINFSPDGRMLACPSPHNFCMLWDTETGRLLHKITTKSEDDMTLVQSYSAAFSPDGTILAFGAEDSVSIWDTASGQLIQTTSPPLYPILSPLVITFSRGRLEAYLSSDRERPSIRLNAPWVLAGTKKLLQLPSDYHPHSWAIYKNTLVIGDLSGRVTILRFEESENGYAV